MKKHGRCRTKTQFKRIEGILDSSVQAVNQLLNQFEQMHKMMKMMKGGNLQRMMRDINGLLPGMR